VENAVEKAVDARRSGGEVLRADTFQEFPELLHLLLLVVALEHDTGLFEIRCRVPARSTSSSA
jgi:hypothetical protein